MTEKVIKEVTLAYKGFPFIEGIVLGGSRATQTATEHSDIDIGIYYDSDRIDFAELNAVAQKLDDGHRENLICREGGWGKWVNCGGWLIMDGLHVDIIMRDWSRVRRVIGEADQGKYSCHYQTGHPHAFMDVMYRGELASCRVLYARGSKLLQVKQQAEIYPPALKKALIEFFLFEAEFSCMLAEKSLDNRDVYYLTGHIFRSVSAMNQALFALNEKWLLNEKKAVFRIDTFEIRPDGYSRKIKNIFENAPKEPALSLRELRELCSEVTALCS